MHGIARGVGSALPSGVVAGGEERGAKDSFSVTSMLDLNARKDDRPYRGTLAGRHGVKQTPGKT